MAKLTSKQRNALPAKEFALPKERKYPVENKSHAANAKARAQQQFDKGNISKSTLSKIDAKANKKLKQQGAIIMKGRSRSDTSPVNRSPTLVPDRVMYEPNFDAKYQTGMETARNKVGKKVKPQSNMR